MSELLDDIAAFDRMKAELETQHLGSWVVVRGSALAGVFDNFDEAARTAVERFGRGPYLIRQVGAPPLTLPASVMYRQVHEGDAVRIR